MSPAWFDHQKRGQASVSVRISNSVRTIHHLHCLTWERRRGEQGGSVWENRDDARSTGCNQGEMLHVAVVTQACIHVAVVIHTCLLLPPAMTLRDRKVSFQDHNGVRRGSQNHYGARLRVPVQQHITHSLMGSQTCRLKTQRCAHVFSMKSKQS